MTTSAGNSNSSPIDADVRDLVPGYLANRRQDLLAVRAALACEDFESIITIGHNMQGSGRAYGFEGLTTIGVEFQRAAAARNVVGIGRLERSLADYMSRIEIAATQWRDGVSAAPVTAVAGGGEQSAYDARHKILLVDDQEMNRLLIGRYLHAAGYAAEVAAGGDEALARLAMEPPPAVVLLDVVMGGLDGYDVCRRIKAAPATRAIPVVLITGLDSPRDRDRGIDAGADDFLTKPVQRQELAALVRSLVQLSLARRALERH